MTEEDAFLVLVRGDVVAVCGSLAEAREEVEVIVPDETPFTILVAEDELVEWYVEQRPARRVAGGSDDSLASGPEVDDGN